jgi:hypothetical protein
MDTVLEINNLSNANQIQAGQTIQVPWPTLTPRADTSTNKQENTTITNTLPANVNNSSAPQMTATETLQPGVSWHKVQKDENIIIIALEYGANLRILSELNPEITFSQCDFGLGSGGPNCIVSIYEGQLIRVPSPTQTPTVQPTPSGSETPTATATATFNAPSLLAPDQNMLFSKDQFITLRWTSTGSLSLNQGYLVSVEDLTTHIKHSASTTELYYIIPKEWHHNTNERHTYTWTVAVVSINNPNFKENETEPRQFIWQGT